MRISSIPPTNQEVYHERMACQYSLSEGLCYLKKVFGVDPERLTPERTTIRFELDGSHRQVAHDDWRGKTRTDDGSSWRGYTFFRLGALQSTATASGSTEPAVRPLQVYEETESVESCGSYEMIDPTTGDRP